MPAPITQTVCFFFELSFSLLKSSLLLPSGDDAMTILTFLSFVRGTTSATRKCSFSEVLLWRSYNAENMRCGVVHDVE